MAGAGLSFFIADQVRKNQKALGESEEGQKTIARRQVHTGRYGTTADVYPLLTDPTQIIKVVPDRDLSGVPCYWVYLRNGIPYQTYQYPAAAALKVA